jgi:rod shape-determining protein MreD
LILATVMLIAIVIQTTLFGQIQFLAPDLVMLVVILLALTHLRQELILLIGFTGGLIVDLLGSSLVGLRAVVFTMVAYLAMRTRDRVDIGRPAIAVWVGLLTLVGIVLIVVIGTLFGQTSLVGAGIGRRFIVIPLANLIIAALIAPLFVRLIDRDSGSVRFS